MSNNLTRIAIIIIQDKEIELFVILENIQNYPSTLDNRKIIFKKATINKETRIAQKEVEKIPETINTFLLKEIHAEGVKHVETDKNPLQVPIVQQTQINLSTDSNLQRPFNIISAKMKSLLKQNLGRRLPCFHT